jgi:hypothetical protein
VTRRRQNRGPDLTSLIDVLFILVFAALIQTASHVPDEVEAAEPEPEPAPVVDAGVPDAASQIPTPELAGRIVVLARVDAGGILTALEVAGGAIQVGLPLVEPSPDPDVVLAYAGDRSPDLRVCRIVALTIAVPDLSNHVVVITTARPLEELTHALAEGLRRDVGRCLADQAGLAILVDPATMPGFTP